MWRSTNTSERRGAYAVLSLVTAFCLLYAVSVWGTTEVGGVLSSDATWTVAGSPYIVINDLTVDQGVTLTVEPDVVVKFKSRKNISVNGALSAFGKADSLIVFTSYLDDDYGGDSNGDGNLSGPGPGDWGRIQFNDTSDDTTSGLSYCLIQYGGSSDAMVYLKLADTPISHSTIYKSGSRGIQLANSFATISDNTITWNDDEAIRMDLDSFPTFSGNVVSDNGTNGIGVSGGTVTIDGIWDATGLAYVVQGDITVDRTAVWTLAPGVVIKFTSSSNDIWVQGTLRAVGTPDSPIVFTSIYDDQYAGDTNGDGDLSRPSPGQWGQIKFEDTSVDDLCIFDHVLFIYGGSPGQMIWYNIASPAITNSVVSYSQYDGIRVTDEGGGLIISDNRITDNGRDGIVCSAAFPVIERNIITNNGDDGVYSDNAAEPDLGGGLLVLPDMTTISSAGGNHLYNNRNYDLNHRSRAIDVRSPILMATNNFWGTSDTTVIAQHIYDGEDNSTYQKVAYLPIAGQDVISPSAVTDLIAQPGGGRGEIALTWTAPGDDTTRGTAEGYIIKYNKEEITAGNWDASTDLVGEPTPGPAGTAEYMRVHLDADSTYYFALKSFDEAGNVSGLSNSPSATASSGMPTAVSGTISPKTTWREANSPYIVTGPVTVTQGDTLTIEPGVVVKFNNNNYLNVYGTLLADGTEAKQIVFTSNDPNPAPGKWRGIHFYESSDTSSVMDYSVVRFGGGYGEQSNVYIENSSPKITNSTISDSYGYGIRCVRNAAVNTSPRITGNTIVDNRDYALYMDVNSDPLLWGNRASGNGWRYTDVSRPADAYDGAAVGGGTLTGDREWDNDEGLPYILQGNITIHSAGKLTIHPESVIRFNSQYMGIRVDGILAAVGTSAHPIRFGPNLVAPRPGSWGRIYFTDTSKDDYSRLIYCDFEYGGYGGQTLYAENASPTIRNSRIALGSGHGIYGSNSNAVITDNVFEANTGAAINIGVNSFPTFSGNAATGNGWNGIYVRGGDITQTATWRSDLPYIAEGFSVHDGTVLTIAPGQIVKFTSYAVLTVNGTLIADGTPDKPIVFTSYRDGRKPPASIASAASVGPSPGDWQGIQFTDTSDDKVCILNHSVIKYAGYYGRAVYCENASPTISHSTIAYSSGTGIRLANSKAKLIGNTITDNAGVAFYMDVHSFPTFDGNTVIRNGGNGIWVQGGTMTASDRWDYDGIPYFVEGWITVAEGAVFRIDPGNVVKFNAYTGFTVAGALIAEGTPDHRITFTSRYDTSAASPGDWREIQFTDTSDDLVSVLDYCDIEYGGYYGYSVYLKDASPTISNCILRKSAGSGIYLENSGAMIRDNAFVDNAQYAINMDVNSFPTLSGNTASGNGTDGIRVRGGTMSVRGRWNSALPYFTDSFTIGSGAALTVRPGNELRSSHITVADGGTLTIAPDNVLKFNRYSGLDVYGALIADGRTADSTIVFTANQDTPKPGDWREILFRDSSVDSLCILNHTVVEYGGYYGYNIYSSGASPTITNSEIRYSSNDGIRCGSGAQPTILANKIYGNQGYGLRNDDTSVQVVAEYNYWGDPSGPNDPWDNTDRGGLYNPEGKGDTVYDYWDYLIDYSPWIGRTQRIIPLAHSWNLFSFNIDTPSDSIRHLTTSIAGNFNRILGFYDGGVTYDPALEAFSTLKLLDPYHGYWILMDRPDTLAIGGVPVQEDTPIPLNRGWNLVSYLPADSMAVTQALASIQGNYSVVLGFYGGAVTYDPTLPVQSTLLYMKPNYGYWIKMTARDTLVYLRSGAPAAKVAYLPSSAAETPQVVPSNEWINVYGKVTLGDGTPVPAGTVIYAVDPDGVVCGSYVVRKSGQYGFIAIYRDSPVTDRDEGARPGDEITFLIGDAPAVGKIRWTTFGDVVEFDLRTLPTLVTDRRNGVPETYGLEQNSPNPFNPSTTIRYQLKEDAWVVLKIYDAAGRRVRILRDGEERTGYRQVAWDGTDDQGRRVGSGIYFYRIHAGPFSDTKKMILMK